tara:strand:- start:67 stop:1245 length:1179 start_codon:yes stop_codon:yes gene_type:complete
MAIAYTYPQKATPVNDDLIIISDSAEDNKTKQIKVGDLPFVGSAGVASINIGHGTSTGLQDALKINSPTGAVELTINKYAGTDNVGYVPQGGSATTFLRGDGTWVTPTDTNTTYTAGDGLDLTGTEFSTDLKANGGLVIEATELAVDLGASAITGTLAVADGGTGVTAMGDGFVLLGSGLGPITALDVTAKGSLLVGDGTTDPVALPVGTNNYVLTADSTQASGVKWAQNTGIQDGYSPLEIYSGEAIQNGTYSTFTQAVSDTNITGINKAKIFVPTASANNITIGIYEGALAGTPSGSLLGTAELTSVVAGVNVFTFSSPFNLTAGQNIVIYCSTADCRPLGKSVTIDDADLSLTVAGYLATPNSSLATATSAGEVGADAQKRICVHFYKE